VGFTAYRGGSLPGCPKMLTYETGVTSASVLVSRVYSGHRPARFPYRKSSTLLGTANDLTLLTSARARYRVRADYTRSAADTTNINTDGSWLCFKVVE
jgi:hypothetical protein